MGKNTRGLKLKREFSAGGVVFKRIKELESGRAGIKWLVTKSSPNRLYPQEIWRLPKGWIDNEREDAPGPISKGEKKATENEPREAALREVKEEGGVEARIVKKIGTTKYFITSTRGKVLKFVTFYLMEWVRDLPEGTDFETSEVAWFPFDAAYERLSFQGEKEVLKKAKEILETPTSN